MVKIVDQAARFMSDFFPVERTKPKPSTTVGFPGTVVFGGQIYSPERASELRGSEKYRTYADLLSNVSIVAASVRYFLNLISDADWKFEPAVNVSPEQAEQGVKLAEMFLHSMQTPWPRIVRQTAMYKFYGFAIQEWTAMRNEDGLIVFRDIEIRPQSTITRWDLKANGDVVGVVQTNPANSQDVYLPRDKLIYIVDTSLSDSPEGLGLLRHVVPLIERLRRIEQLELFGYESDLRGVPIAYAPLNELNEMVQNNLITPAAAASAIEPLRRFIENHQKGPNNGIMIDSSTYRDNSSDRDVSQMQKYRMELLAANIRSTSDIDRAIIRLHAEIARIMNTEQLLLGTDKQGSHALSTDKTQALHSMVNATLKELSSVYSADMLERLWDLNGLPKEIMPRYKPELVRYKDIEATASAIRDLAISGVVLDRDDEAVREYFTLIGLTPPEGRITDDRPGSDTQAP